MHVTAVPHLYRGTCTTPVPPHLHTCVSERADIHHGQIIPFYCLPHPLHPPPHTKNPATALNIPCHCPPPPHPPLLVPFCFYSPQPLPPIVPQVKFLVQAGADVRARAYGTFFQPGTAVYYGEYSLSFAASTGQKDIVSYLKRHGARINVDRDMRWGGRCEACSKLKTRRMPYT